MKQLAEQVEKFKTSPKTNIAVLRPYTSCDDTLYRDIEEVCAGLGVAQIVDEIFLHSY